jgi:hypothetical protein
MGEEEEETLEEIDGSEPEREVRHGTSVFMRKDDSGLEDEFEYLWEAHIPSDPDEPEEDRWWSPEPPEPSSEEDEEEVRYLTEILELEPQGDKARQGGSPPLQRRRPARRRVVQRRHASNGKGNHQGRLAGGSHPAQGKPGEGSSGRR